MYANTILWKLGAFSAGTCTALQTYIWNKAWTPEKKFNFCRALEVQFSSAIGLMLLANYKLNGKLRIGAAIALHIGSILFSHIIYFRCFFDDKRFNFIMPYGGGLLITGWILIACL